MSWGYRAQVPMMSSSRLRYSCRNTEPTSRWMASTASTTRTIPSTNLSWAQTFVRVVNSAAIGALKKALKIFVETRTAAATSDPTKLAGDVETQTRIAQVMNTIAELEAVMFYNFDQMESSDWQPSIEERVLFRYQASLVIDKAIDAIDTLFDVAGGRAVFNGHPLQNLWHDIHIARCHVANNPTGFARNLGAMQLGMENQDVFV